MPDLEARKAQELLCYLLLYRGRPHSRESLANLLWSNGSIAQSKKYLRKALWQLHTTLDSPVKVHKEPLLRLEPEWIGVNEAADLWLDVAEFERAFTQVQNVPGRLLDTEKEQALQDAVELYRGDLLEGWYQDWCLFERERLHNMYLASLDKLIAYCEVHGKYETGLLHGIHILRSDYARERTHRRMMRLYYLSGDRTSALQQYKRCAVALREELDVEPARRTTELYEQIRADQPLASNVPLSDASALNSTDSPVLHILQRLIEMRELLNDAHDRVQQDIQSVEQLLDNRR